MPYIITTRIDVHGDRLSMDVTSRRAVATLDEAREDVHEAIDEADRGMALDPLRELHKAVAALTESGGTIGPLPDGTVVSVYQSLDASRRKP